MTLTIKFTQLDVDLTLDKFVHQPVKFLARELANYSSKKNDLFFDGVKKLLRQEIPNYVKLSLTTEGKSLDPEIILGEVNVLHASFMKPREILALNFMRLNEYEYNYTLKQLIPIWSYPRIFVPKDEICSICLSSIFDQEVTTVLKCPHYFHFRCLKMWMQTSKTCPLCRTVLN
jgi:hypothetical protein